MILQQNQRALPHGARAAQRAVGLDVRQNAGDKHGLEARDLGCDGRVRRVGVLCSGKTKERMGKDADRELTTAHR